MVAIAMVMMCDAEHVVRVMVMVVRAAMLVTVRTQVVAMVVKASLMAMMMR